MDTRPFFADQSAISPFLGGLSLCIFQSFSFSRPEAAAGRQSHKILRVYANKRLKYFTCIPAEKSMTKALAAALAAFTWNSNPTVVTRTAQRSSSVALLERRAAPTASLSASTNSSCERRQGRVWEQGNEGEMEGKRELVCVK